MTYTEAISKAKKLAKHNNKLYLVIYDDDYNTYKVSAQEDVTGLITPCGPIFPSDVIAAVEPSGYIS